MLISVSGKARSQFIRPEPDSDGFSVCQTAECNARFPTWSHHVRHAHTERLQKCGQCQMTFKKPCDLRRHEQTHFAVRPTVSCSRCNSQLLNKRSLEKHLRRVHAQATRVACPLCSRTFADASYTAAHTQLAHSNLQTATLALSSRRKPAVTWACSFCLKRCVTAAVLLMHLRGHTGEKTFGCSRCPFWSARKRGLAIHLKFMHMPLKRSIKCEHCAHTCDTNAQMERHVSIRHSFRCSVCGSALFHRNAFMRHLRKHAGEKWLKPEPKKFKCSYCLKKFHTRVEVAAHISTHTGRHQHRCEICDKAFARPASLVQHRYAQHSEKYGSVVAKFKCGMCSYACVAASQLRNHLSVHSLQKSFQCDECPASFSRKSYADRHRRLKHREGGKKHKCSLCPAVFDYAGHLTRHIERLHKRQHPVRCAVCGTECHEKNHLVAHLYRHTGIPPYRCDQCTANYASSSALRNHIARIHANTRHHCSACEATFAIKKHLTRHMKFHAPQKPYAV